MDESMITLFHIKQFQNKYEDYCPNITGSRFPDITRMYSPGRNRTRHALPPNNTSREYGLMPDFTERSAKHGGIITLIRMNGQRSVPVSQLAKP